MFNNKSRSHKNSVIPNPALRSLSILSVSAVVKGEITIEDDLRIDGNVDGDIHSGGKVVIGPEGCVKGKITGKSVEVIGKVLGDVTVSDIVILKASSYYEGQIIARNIEIEAGASFYGNCRMEGDDKKELSEKVRVIPGRSEIAIPVVNADGKEIEE
ncbi:polymer-forming cytoskeletal protein [Dysgonomonas sp. Marseille-P4677]|uniref:bactofilin family protein n=1 Tax=Dysgonomonas sp. Marseille-P4677 TaxID=2364790 RepID=UPI001914533F|nr:polymer-forming cytoskeletal protein [Dysgonomonas sp. Marseille-P4677]MBK5719726.1 polymer-forming cytoskeletal protein [Dysgonomonas sp. Marseille-P4677]